MQAAFDVARAIAIGDILNAVAAAVMEEAAVGTVPDAEYGIDVGPERVVVDVVGGSA